MDQHKKSSGKSRSSSRRGEPPRTDLPGLAARRAALALLLGVRRDGMMLGEAEATALAGLDPADQARARRLAVSALRHEGRAGAMLAPLMERRPPLAVRLILDLALAECLAEAAPAHAAVQAAVALAQEGRKTGAFAGLVNAVLRRALEAGGWETLPPMPLPVWIGGPVRKAWGKEVAAAISAAHGLTPPVDLTPKDGDATALAARVGGTALPSGSVRLDAGVQVSALPGFAEGDWWVQDAAAALPARVLAARAGERVLDLCAAPGGKTLQLAASGADVTALDVSEGRMRRVTANLARCGLVARTVIADATGWTPPAPYDAILLDAPCSASGTLRRHPDLPFLKDGSEVPELAALQAALIDRALGWLKPGGRLVFCTCSLLPVEGETAISRALARHPDLRVRPLDPVAFGLPMAAGTETGLRLRPDFWAERGGMDGFFVALLGR